MKHLDYMTVANKIMTQIKKDFAVHASSVLPVEHRPVMVRQRKSRRHMNIPTPCVVDGPSTRFDQPHDDPLDGAACVLAPYIKSPDQMEQVVCEKAHLQPGFVRPEPVAARLVPAQGVLAFLDPVFNISSPVVHLDHFTRCKP